MWLPNVIPLEKDFFNFEIMKTEVRNDSLHYLAQSYREITFKELKKNNKKNNVSVGIYLFIVDNEDTRTMCENIQS